MNNKNERCFYSADSLVIKFKNQKMRHWENAKYRLSKDKIIVWSETQPKLSGRIDELEVFHAYNEAKR